jgi:hypothetical protein
MTYKLSIIAPAVLCKGANAMPHRQSAHRRHPAHAPRPAPSGIHSPALGAQLIIAALSFVVIASAAFRVMGSALAN